MTIQTETETVTFKMETQSWILTKKNMSLVLLMNFELLLEIGSTCLYLCPSKPHCLNLSARLALLASEAPMLLLPQLTDEEEVR